MSVEQVSLKQLLEIDRKRPIKAWKYLSDSEVQIWLATTHLKSQTDYVHAVATPATIRYLRQFPQINEP